ncbi:MAG: PilZ domain-containing protein [Candidatus Tantalella remota]|nr:PilZ domain-containing protein [Candidatus Tantalella remota]
MKLKLPERRRFVRIDIPLKIVIENGGITDEVLTKNISPVGLRFGIPRELKKDEPLKITLYLPEGNTPIGLDAKIIWQIKTSLEDKAPYDVGVEIVSIEEDCKNTFLKYLCDLLYKSTYKERE